MRVRAVDMLVMHPPSLTRGRSFCVKKNTPLNLNMARDRLRFALLAADGP
jgi:hypothetical protein